jgi:DNA-binding CsgD family transcriptional regulator
MSVFLPAPQGWSQTLLVERQSVDFGERERTLLNLLQLHVSQLRRSVEIRRHARATIQTVPTGTLTERETEVLLHVAEGRNREIAPALWVSPGTVRRHLDNIYTKLGVHNRAAAAARLHNREALSSRYLTRPRCCSLAGVRCVPRARERPGSRRGGSPAVLKRPLLAGPERVIRPPGRERGSQRSAYRGR